MQVVMDFETRSAVDIGAQGAFVYAADPSTEIMCLAMAVDDGKPLLWVPERFRSGVNPIYKMISAKEMHETVLSADKVIAHNASFEYVIWRKIAFERLGWPALPLEKLHCTMAQCAYHALPLSLDQAAQALNLHVKKDMRGHSMMLKLCKPRKPLQAERTADPNWASKLHWHEDPADLTTLFNYGGRDVEVERQIYKTLAPLPPFERKIWLLDQRINLRGIPIDTENIQAIIEVTGTRETEQLAEFQRLTNGQVSGPRSYVALKDWVNEQTGLQLVSVDKATVADLLTAGKLPPVVAQVLEIKAELSKSSVAKFKSMSNRVNSDGRLRGMFQYGGASTLRWAARGVQLHNQPRDSYGPKTWEEVAALFRAHDAEAISMLYDDPFFVASRCVRGALCTKPGTRFICADFSSIEARGNAFLAGEQSAIDVFLAGKDPYRVAAQSIFGVPYDNVTKDQRQVGKVSELALGYNGGIGAYATMAKGYGIDLETLPARIMPRATFEELDGPYGATALAKGYLAQNPGSMSLEAAIACDVIKRKWRATHPNIVRFWNGLHEAAYQAVETPGTVFGYRDIRYCVHNNFLKCLLPSGRLMHYYSPKISDVMATWGETKPAITYMGMKVVDGATTRQWARLATFGGKLCIAEDTPVLTRGGWKPIQHIAPDELVWDGEQWVGHGGVVCNGEAVTIEAHGVKMTSGHLILTMKGWRNASSSEGYNRFKSRLPNCFKVRGIGWEKIPLVRGMRMWKNSETAGDGISENEKTGYPGIMRMYEKTDAIGKTDNPRNVPPSGFCGVAQYVMQMRTAITSGLQKLRRAGDQGVQAVARFIRGFLGGHGRGLQAGSYAGQNKQRRKLHQKELQVGRTPQASTESKRRGYRKWGKRVVDITPNRDQPFDAALSSNARVAGRQVGNSPRFPEQVYDIVNCGPAKRYTVRSSDGRPLIVHNCENVVQAYCRDLLAEAMLRLEAAGYPQVLHVHDECAAEMPDGLGSLENFRKIMSVVPAWAVGMPITADGWEGRRYRKG